MIKFVRKGIASDIMSVARFSGFEVAITQAIGNPITKQMNDVKKANFKLEANIFRYTNWKTLK